MKNMLQEFKDFVNRGNLVELAIAFVLATAFAPVVLSIVDNIFMPIIAAIIGEPDFSSLGFDIGDARINYGTPLTLIINFLVIAFVCFLVVKAYNASKKSADEEDDGPSEVELLTEIRDALRNRYFGPQGELFREQQTRLRPAQERLLAAIEVVATDGLHGDGSATDIEPCELGVAARHNRRLDSARITQGIYHPFLSDLLVDAVA